MELNTLRIRELLKTFDFQVMFIEELGWDHHNNTIEIILDGQPKKLQSVAQKRGMVAYHFPTLSEERMPDYPIRRKIENQVAKATHEHFIIYTDAEQTTQIWQWVKREPGKPIACREHRFHCTQPGDALIQKLTAIAFSLDEEETLTLTDVTRRAKAGFDVEKITKRFYDRFKKEHATFLKFVKGISDETDLEWYVSVMLNRLMFVYFIQRKGFLDFDPNYLRDRLTRTRLEYGKDKFYSFYRYFLLRLFHEGLGGKERPAELAKLLGKVPYFNGGLFEKHPVEQRYPDINIPDKAFERIFDYFDQYQWHLDERPLRADNEINPDVLGYIFEKYINQKQMGAYYTKEDITEYISKNTVISFLINAARTKCKVAFENPSGPTVWDLLVNNPARYIYPAVKYGVIRDDGSLIPEAELPDFVLKGIHDANTLMFESRYNLQPAPAGNPFLLVTETWREYVKRRTRCLKIREKLLRGEVQNIDDLITFNLDIRQFAQDVIESSEGPDLLRAFWQSVERVTILDPTCGSGAFLFAALSILEPLYEACLERMETFVEDLNRSNQKHTPKKLTDFREILGRVDSHPNRRYFIFKCIILNNLFGLDIMDEAVEICKLRLFLKLVAQVEPHPKGRNFGIEPLPDIDFNIRSGNTLVGYATVDDVRRAFQEEPSGKHAQYKLMLGDKQSEYDKFEEQVRIVDNAFKKFRAMQTDQEGLEPKDFANAKLILRERLEVLEKELNRHLAREYGVKPKEKATFDKWLKSHQPFHWFVEFYDIMQSGGFDVIIGNPPYVEYKDVQANYKVGNYRTKKCSNLYAFVLERNANLAGNASRVGMIVPLSACSTDRMIPLIRQLKITSSDIKIANFSWRPGKLFEGVNLQLSIIIQQIGKAETSIDTTQYILWDSEARSELFSRIEFAKVFDESLPGSIPKLGSSTAASILNKLRSSKNQIGMCFTKNSKNRVYYRRGGLYWKVFVDFRTDSSEEKIISLQSDIDKYAVIAALSSDLWFWYLQATSDCRHLGNRDISTFPFNPRDMNPKHLSELCNLGRDYVRDLRENAENTIRVYKKKKAVECLSFKVNQSKSIINKIDHILAKHYDFTNEELDFIINYDIKYRMGRVLEGMDKRDPSP